MISFSTYDFHNKRALVRVDFNVPLNKETNEVSDDTRIRAALPTINHILTNGGSVVLLSHFGRPKNGPENQFSLQQIIYKIEELLGRSILFCSDCIGENTVKIAQALKPGEVLLVENVRFHPEETIGDKAFAEQLAKLGDCYVNDAFGTAHRAHASTTIIAEFFPNDKMFGLLLAAEIISVDRVLNSTEHPVTAIIGGAKVSSKITIIEQLLDRVDNIIVGGGMAYTFVKAQGGKVGSSLVEDDFLTTAVEVLAKAKAKGVHFYVPTDTVVADKFDNNAATQIVSIDEIPDGWMGLDVGPDTINDCAKILEASKVILWNGPMGVFEMENFRNGTAAVADAIVRATKQGAFSLIGGGDSVAAINLFGLAKDVSYVSTGGGAMLEYLEGIELPGIKAIRS